MQKAALVSLRKTGSLCEPSKALNLLQVFQLGFSPKGLILVICAFLHFLKAPAGVFQALALYKQRNHQRLVWREGEKVWMLHLTYFCAAQKLYLVSVLL